MQRLKWNIVVNLLNFVDKSIKRIEKNNNNKIKITWLTKIINKKDPHRDYFDTDETITGFWLKLGYLIVDIHILINNVHCLWPSDKFLLLFSVHVCLCSFPETSSTVFMLIFEKLQNAFFFIFFLYSFVVIVKKRRYIYYLLVLLLSSMLKCFFFFSSNFDYDFVSFVLLFLFFLFD